MQNQDRDVNPWFPCSLTHCAAFSVWSEASSEGHRAGEERERTRHTGEMSARKIRGKGKL